MFRFMCFIARLVAKSPSLEKVTTKWSAPQALDFCNSSFTALNGGFFTGRRVATGLLRFSITNPKSGG
jgi:hypothetical protein